MTTAAGEGREIDPGEWLCIGRYCGAMGPGLKASAQGLLSVARMALPGRVQAERWVRYRIALAEAPASSPDVQLIPVTDEIIRALHAHPDHAADQLRSGFRFWEQGLRRAYIWMSGAEPVCIQWLLLGDDIGRLHNLGVWAGMYAPLPPRCGQVENLFAFSTARRKGAATQFEYALYALARQMGLAHLVTHIYEANMAARGWADRTGWRSYGTITRYGLDVPVLRGYNAFVHDRSPVARPAPVLAGHPVGVSGP